MSKLIIYPYKMQSESSKLLRDKLGALRVYPDGAYRYRIGDIVINWGNSNVPNWYESVGYPKNMLNHPINVSWASNKFKTLIILRDNDIKTPDFTTSKFIAIDNFNKIIVRHKLTGHSGDGIEIVDSVAYGVPDAPLYTEYIPAKAEYRVHIFDGNVIDITKKVRSTYNETDEYDYSSYEPTEEEMMIKSHRNGWDFARGGIKFSPELGRVAIQSIKALGLDFGAVDIIRGEDNELYVLEINTAIGLADTTLNSYSNAIMNYTINHE